MEHRALRQRVTSIVVVAWSVVTAAACVSSSDGGQAHACFVKCDDETTYCGEGPGTEQACNERAVQACEGSTVLQAKKVDGCTCDKTACAPDWYLDPTAPACAGVLECNAAFESYLSAVPACGACLKSACAAEVGGCGPEGEACEASIACFADPLVADMKVPGGACAAASPYETWPTFCYFFREACGAIRQTEPAGLALAQCLVKACLDDCFTGVMQVPGSPGSVDVTACDPGPPPCSTLAGGG